ncbi:tyrosine-type recombinase/integrase [Extensimonas vulgaris]|uniref:Integrase n=1 Tax=Extensimonas vulgaris TaxID=1031594 RepID=A0A369AKW1_9BURK|nr:tyrosine-type recombinase/integrase [Extensimonas vulgaris]RCX09811.1 integrase [Extensimonas vulgaris]
MAITWKGASTVDKINFTAARVANFTCPPGKAQAFLWDADAPGLGLRVTSNGAASYIFQARANGAPLRVTIGHPSTWPLPQARAKARELRQQIDQGHDPREVKRERAQQAAAARALQQAAQVRALDVWDAYCEERKPAWGALHYRDHRAMVAPGGEPKTRGKGGPGVTAPGPLRELLDKPLSTLTAAAVEGWAKRHAPERPTVARLGLRLLRSFVSWCAAHPDYGPAIKDANAAKSRKAREQLGTPKAKGDALQREQLPAWFAAARQQEPAIAAYLQALLLAGARPGELRDLRWEDLDFTWKSMRIRDKVEGERTIPLTPYVSTLLQALPRRGAWVFMTARTDGPITSPNHQLTRTCATAGVPHVTLHGLRRSFGTLAEWVEAPTGVVAQIMGHKPSAIAEKHYRARPLDLLRMWHTKIEGAILEAAGIAQPQEDAQRLRVVQ